MFVMQPAVDLLLADCGAGRGGVGDDLGAERLLHPVDRVVRLGQGARPIVVQRQPHRSETRRRGDHQGGQAVQLRERHFHQKLRRPAQGFPCVSEKPGQGPDPGQRGGGHGGIRHLPRQQAVERLAGVPGPQRGIAPPRMFVLEAEEEYPDVVQQRGPVDLVIGIVDVQILDGTGDRPQRGDVQPDRVGIESAQPLVLARRPGARRRGRIEVIPEIEERAAEFVGGGH
jgi:hypothetical protein